MITRFRTHAPAAGLGLFYSLVIPAVLSAVCWALYLPGWIGAEVFVAALWFCLEAFVLASVVVLVTWTAVALADEEQRS
ncbi:hypothetical protein [Nocardia wallacei]|uniref:hypothetical protein n=1 Tax=Nocardia wallacei TaxID=480035 RepID=UPI00245842D0|nr:hypothetical protein [Nocardia wallacei]